MRVSSKGGRGKVDKPHWSHIVGEYSKNMLRDVENGCKHVRIFTFPPAALCSLALAAVGILGAALAAKSTFCVAT